MTTCKQAYLDAITALPQPSDAMQRYIRRQRALALYGTNNNREAAQAAYAELSDDERRALREISRAVAAEYPEG